jgi:hypothetical protein
VRRLASSAALASAFALTLAFTSFGVCGSAYAKKKTKTSATVKKGDGEKLPAPDDKGTNEGGAGRRNATEDAARSAESPTNERRP